MRTLIMAATLSVIGVAAPSAQTSPMAKAPTAPAPPAAPLGPPRAYQGYAQPEITPAYCRVVNANQTTCTLPAMTAGRYMVKATGTSTAQGAGAMQQLTIVVGNRACGPATLSGANSLPQPPGVSGE